MLLFQYQLFGGFIATIIASLVSASISGITGVNQSSLYQGMTLVLLFLLIIASYWAFLRWMLKENVSDMQVAIIRSKAIQTQEKENASAAVSPDSALQRTEDS